MIAVAFVIITESLSFGCSYALNFSIVGVLDFTSS